MKKRNHPLLSRMTAWLLALICVLGLLPISAFAAGDTIKLERFGRSDVSYQSAALGSCRLHQMYFGGGGSTTVGFCGSKGKKMNISFVGQTWNNKKTLSDPTVELIMAYYYSHSTGRFTDQARALGVDEIWDNGYTWYMNAWTQACIWRYKEGTLGADPVVACAEELMAVYNSLEGTHYTSIDEVRNGASFRDRTKYIFDLGTAVWGTCTVYEYTYAGTMYAADDVQLVILGDHNVGTTDPRYSITIKKVDASNPTLGLAGASFHVESANGTYSKDVVSGPDGTVTLENLSAMTYAITETAPPTGGYGIDNAGPYYVVLPNGNSNEVTVTFSDSPEITGAGSIRKVDADNPNRGIAGAVVKIDGVDNSFTGTYTSGPNGYFTDIPWTTMPVGSYTAEEITPPGGYSLSSDPAKVRQSFHWDGTNDINLVFENDALVKLQLTKLDDSGAPLQGTIFNVLKDGQIIATEETNAAGKITVPDISEGLFTFVEVFAPTPFARLQEPLVVHVDQADVLGGGTISVTAADKRLPTLTVKKLWDKDSSGIPGTVFEVRGIHTGFHEDVTTGADGTVTITTPVDSFVVTEKSVPEPFALGSEDPQTLWLGPGDNETLIFTNKKKPYLTITKTEKGSNPANPIADTAFLVEAIDGDYQSVWTTGTDGSVSGYLEEGSYKITEQSVPAPFFIPDKDADRMQVISLSPGDEKTVAFEDSRYPELTILKLDSITGSPVEGAKFHVTYTTNGEAADAPAAHDYGYFYTDGKGEIKLHEQGQHLYPGTYTCEEVEAAAGYHLNEPLIQTVTLHGGDVKTLTYKDAPLSALIVWKYDSVSGEAVEGATFEVKYLAGTSGTGGTVIGLFTTGSNGAFVLTGLRAGTYVVQELSAPSSHVIDSAPQTAYLSGADQDVVQLYFGNSPKGSVLISKIDADSRAPLSDVEFFITDSNGTVIGNANGKYVTDSAGTILLENLDPSMTLVIKETIPKANYSLDDVPQTVKVKSGETVRVEFRNRMKGSLLIVKKDAVTGEPLSDVEFLVTDSAGNVVGNANGKFVTDSAGTILIEGLTPDMTVVARELRTKSTHILDDTPQTIKIKANETVRLEFRNQPRGALVIVKKDSVTGAPLEGVEFKVTTSDGAVVANKGGQVSSNGIYYTDKNGQIVITGLEPNTYIITELNTIQDYTIHEATRSTTVVLTANDTQTITVYNDPIGGVELIKVSESDRSKRIPDTTFEIRRIDGGLVTTVTTDKNGRVYAALEAGDYYAVEVVAGAGFQLDDTPHYFIVSNSKTTTLTITNRLKSGIQIHKIDSSTGEGVYGVSFLLYDANHVPMGQYTSDQKGYVYIEDLTPGRYYLRELEAEGYVVDTQEKTVYVSGKIATIEWKNQPITGQIQVLKYAAEFNEVTGTPAGTPLQGAVYEISNARSGAVVDYITTDARGVAASKPLPLTRYKVVEVTAPAYWQLDPTVHDVTLEYAGQIIKVSAYDKAASLGVAITKRGNAEVMAGGSMRYDFTVANTSNVPLESFFWHDRLPTDASTATVLTTGTYNARLNYRVLYKTNYMSDYQVLSSNLLTSNNYSFSLNAIPTQLGEKVTDLYFDFGKVPVGFQSLVKPSLTVTASGTVVNGYQMVNRADVGGKYQGTWQTARASWVTIIRRFTPVVIPKLPKTGY